MRRAPIESIGEYTQRLEAAFVSNDCWNAVERRTAASGVPTRDTLREVDDALVRLCWRETAGRHKGSEPLCLPTNCSGQSLPLRRPAHSRVLVSTIFVPYRQTRCLQTSLHEVWAKVRAYVLANNRATAAE